MLQNSIGFGRLFCFCSVGFLILINQACSSKGGSDYGESLFDPDHLVEVKIEIASNDWDTLRNEGRRMTEIFSGCATELEYTWFDATVTINGKTWEHVAVRKKGYLGSLSLVRPGLKLDFDRNVDGQTAWGTKSITLNNDKQDASNTHQCMAYQLFREAGSPAPLCNLARVTVNGKDLGIYSNVESIKKPFLARYFENNDGNLYEGQGADFYLGMTSNFTLKTNEQTNDRSDLDKVLKAMEADDVNLYASLEQVFDMDAFLTFWAMEVITGHWDSYSGDQNNFYTYHDPKTDMFYFIPWGTDAAFSTNHGFLPPDIPKSVYAWSWPTYRLYSDPASRVKYQQKLRTLLDQVWNEEKLLAEVDRIGKLTSADEISLEAQRQFIRTRKQAILNELDSGAPNWTHPPKKNNPICLPLFDISGQFDTKWGDLLSGLALSPQSSFELIDAPTVIPLDLHTKEISQPYEFFLASSGPQVSYNPAVNVGTPQIWIIGKPVASGAQPIVVVLIFEPSLFGEKELPFYALETFGVVARSTGSSSTDITTLGYIGDGKVLFDEVGAQNGDRVTGSFTGVFVPAIFDQLKY